LFFFEKNPTLAGTARGVLLFYAGRNLSKRRPDMAEKREIVDTTLSLHKTQLAKLAEAEKETGLERNEILLHLMRKMMERREELHEDDAVVQYQDRIGGYGIQHIYLQQNDYELKLDMRRYYKISFSKIISIAIRDYLEELVESFDENLTKSSIIIEDSPFQQEILPSFSEEVTIYTNYWRRI
jgi:hypothetical protein